MRVCHLHGVFIILATEVGLTGDRNSWNRNAMQSIVSTKQTQNTGVCIFSADQHKEQQCPRSPAWLIENIYRT